MLSVILDSNILRGWDEPPSFDQFLAAEAAKGIVPLADSWTLCELISNLTIPEAPAYGQCLAGLRRATRRSLLVDPPRLLYPAEAQIAQMLFGTYPPQMDTTMAELVACCRYISAQPPGSALDLAQPTIHQIHGHNTDLEQFFAETSKTLRAQVLSAPADERERTARQQARDFLRSADALAADTAALVKRAYGQMSRPVPDPLPPDAIERVGIATRAGSAALTAALESILCDGANPDNSRIKNFLWDQEVAFSLGQRISDFPVRLVTQDGIFRRAAKTAGVPEAVLPLSEYLALLDAA